MTGPEHYRKAELLLAKAQDVTVGSDSERYFLAAAKAHATLAQAAATVAVGAVRMHSASYKAWNAVTGEA